MATVWADLFKVQQEYLAAIRKMSTEEIVEYTLFRAHCQPLEKELAERLKRCSGNGH